MGDSLNFYGKSYRSADIKRMTDEYMIRFQPFQRYPLVYSDERQELAAGGPSRFPNGKSVNVNFVCDCLQQYPIQTDNSL